MPQFIVTISSSEPTAAEVENSLRYGGYGWLDVSVRKYDPEGEVYTGRITAIKRVRTLLSCSLKDAKFLVDFAEQAGKSSFFGVNVDYIAGGGFRVIDNRP